MNAVLNPHASRNLVNSPPSHSFLHQSLSHSHTLARADTNTMTHLRARLLACHPPIDDTHRACVHPLMHACMRPSSCHARVRTLMHACTRPFSHHWHARGPVAHRGKLHSSVRSWSLTLPIWERQSWLLQDKCLAIFFILYAVSLPLRRMVVKLLCLPCSHQGCTSRNLPGGRPADERFTPPPPPPPPPRARTWQKASGLTRHFLRASAPKSSK